MPLCTMEVQERPAQASVVRLTRSGFFAVFDVLMIIPSGYPDVNSPMVWGSVLLASRIQKLGVSSALNFGFGYINISSRRD